MTSRSSNSRPFRASLLSSRLKLKTVRADKIRGAPRGQPLTPVLVPWWSTCKNLIRSAPICCRQTLAANLNRLASSRLDSVRRRRICLAADPNAAQARTIAALHLDVADAGSPARIAIGIWPTKERRIQHILLCVSTRIDHVDRSHRKCRTCTCRQTKPQSANDAKLSTGHSRAPPFGRFDSNNPAGLVQEMLRHLLPLDRARLISPDRAHQQHQPDRGARADIARSRRGWPDQSRANRRRHRP